MVSRICFRAMFTVSAYVLSIINLFIIYLMLVVCVVDNDCGALLESVLCVCSVRVNNCLYINYNLLLLK